MNTRENMMAVSGLFGVLMSELVGDWAEHVSAPAFVPTPTGVALEVQIPFCDGWETWTAMLDVPTEWLDDAPSLEGMKAHFDAREEYLGFLRVLHHEANEAALDALVARTEPVEYELARCEKDSEEYVGRYVALGVDPGLL